jgi:hypothetical protein
MKGDPRRDAEGLGKGVRSMPSYCDAGKGGVKEL